MLFSGTFRAELNRLTQLRRDVRRFRTDPVPETVRDACLEVFRTAPSVGLSQPWRLVDIASPEARATARANFEASNADALAGYDGDKAKCYAGLKLSGMDAAPIHWAVYCDEETDQGSGLGVQTMPEMRRYSVVCAVMQLWLTARAHGLGLGWVSILDPLALSQALDLPDNWRLIAYLCLGWPEEETDIPVLEREGWEHRHPMPEPILR